MNKSNRYESVSPDVNLAAQENQVLEFWDHEKIFERSLEQTRDKPFFSFYDGPPFATGLPHYGHILAGLLKDVVPRYWTMRGRNVPRYFGWDCHGVPVEYEINKKMNIKSAAEVRDMGVAQYNEACRSIVDRYTSEWAKTVRRMGRWVDMEHGYRTMDLSFMQSVWWVFEQLWKKGWIYEGYKVVPYSIGISTPLSNFEASQNYKMVQDPAITIRFKADGMENTSFLAWTTTPWTLPSNLALAVGLDLDYVKVRGKTGELFIMGESLLPAFAKDLHEKGQPEILERYKGRDLVGKTYQPLFPYFSKFKAQGTAFRVIPSAHVTTDAGTGIVHMAPAFGEEDFYACQENKIAIVNPVDDDCKFTSEVPDYQGRMVKDTDKDIIASLKQNGLLFKQETIEHSYPHCERTDTPLIYKAVSSWFVKIEAFRDRMVANNKKTNWVPESLRDGRFGNWLEGARDWAISRNRFWGTPLPIWRNDAGEVVCVGSVAQLEKLSGKKVTDLHLHHIAQIEIPSQNGKAPLRHVGGVLDCWFESGSMPYAQWGYPYNEDKKANFEKGFPADFIAEGLDQTRGWFYTLMVISSALFDKPAFKNVVVNGIVLAENGFKMSKRLRNYPDPMEVMDRYCADAMRLYLIDSPVVKAQDLRFSEKGVAEIVRKILLRWWNAYSFFVNYANIDGFAPKGDAHASPNILDQWILSRLNSLTVHTNREMEAYRLYNVVPRLLQFIEELTNTYIRFNRRHFWQEGMPEDKRFAYETLHEVLINLSRLMAPFTPFIAETTFRNLSRGMADLKQSVHLEDYPVGREELSKPELERAVGRMEEITVMGRNLREKIKVKGKIPLRSLRIIMRDAAALNELKKLESYFAEELNIREVIYDSNEDASVEISAKANFQRLGKRLGKKMKPVAQAIEKIGIKEILKLESGEPLVIDGEAVSLEDVDIRRAPKAAKDAFLTGREVSIELDPTVNKEQYLEGLSREVVRRIQMVRKNAGFSLDDRIRLEVCCDAELKEAVEAFRQFITGETLAEDFELVSAEPKGERVETFDIQGDSLKVGVTRRARR